MTIPASTTCTRCGWTNPAGARNCRGCGQPLPPISIRHDPDRPPVPAPARATTITGVVTSAPQNVEMTVVQWFWFVVATVVVLFGSVLLHTVVMPLLLFLFLLTLVGHMISGRRRGGIGLPAELIGGGMIANATRRACRGRAIVARRTGQQIRITDGQHSWTVRFLSDRGTDLLMGDPVRVEGRRGPDGYFYAARITNLRTGTTRYSQQLVSWVIVAVCSTVMAVHLAL